MSIRDQFFESTLLPCPRQHSAVGVKGEDRKHIEPTIQKRIIMGYCEELFRLQHNDRIKVGWLAGAVWTLPQMAFRMITNL